MFNHALQLAYTMNNMMVGVQFISSGGNCRGKTGSPGAGFDTYA